MNLRYGTVIACIIILIVCSLTASASVAISHDDYTSKFSSIERIDSFSLESSIESGLRSNINDKVKSSGFSAPETSDVVTINPDGEINVATEEAVSISVYAPFGMLAFTQDILAQLDVYAMMDDPTSIVEALKEMGVHIYMVDLVSEAEVYVSTSSNIVSMLVEDLDELSESDMDELISSVARLEPNANIYSINSGDHKYLVYDYRESGSQVIIYTAIKNNTNIDFQLSISNGVIDEQKIEDMEYLLGDVKLATT